MVDSYPNIVGGYALPPIVPSGRNFSIAAIAGRSRKGLPFERITIDSDNLVTELGKGVKGQPEIYDLFAHVNTYKTNVAEFVRVVDLITAKFPSLELKLAEAVTGTVTIVADSPNVAGTGTAFLTELIEGGIITIGGVLHGILTITDDENLILAVNHVAGVTDATITKNEFATRADTYGTIIALVTSGIFVSLNDGSNEETYGMTITNKTDLELTDGILVPVFTIAFHQKIATVWGAITGESYTVSLDPDAVNDQAESLYLPTVLNNEGSIFKADVKNAFTDHDEIPVISTAMEFTGALAGDAPISADFQTGWDQFSGNDSMAMLGIVPNNDETAAIYAIKLLYDKNVPTAYNIPDNLDVDAGITHYDTIMAGVGNKKRFLAVNYGPITVASDPFYGLPLSLGWAGAMTGASAFGDSGDPAAGEDVGIHSQPAGETRGLISAFGTAKPKYTLTGPDMTKLGNMDINFLSISNSTGAVKIQQARTQIGHNVKPKEKQWGVQKTQAFMFTWFKDYLETVQHESDGVTEKRAKRGGELLRTLLLGSKSIYTPSAKQIADSAKQYGGSGFSEPLTTTFVHNEQSGENDIGLAGYIMGSSENFKVTVMSV